MEWATDVRVKEHAKFDVMNKTARLVKQLQLKSSEETVIDLSFYDTWLEIVQAAMLRNHKTQVFYSMSDSKYAGRFDELLHHSSSYFPRAQLVMAAFDQETYRWFTNHSVPTVLLEHRTIQERVMSAKYKGFLSLLLLIQDSQELAYFSEMDIYWRSTPKLNIGDKDFLVSQHKYVPDGEVNIGFYAAKPTLPVMHLFYRLANWIDLKDSYRPNKNCGAFDQKVMDLAIRGPVHNNAFIGKRGNRPECYFPKEQLDMLVPPTPLRWDFVPATVLDHHPFENLASEELAGVHVWSGFGTPAKQVEWALANFVRHNETH